jgi:GT2 family glycosyltransferase
MGSTPALDPVPPAPITLSVIILSHNRWSMLCATLVRLQRLPELAGTQIIVVDNASADDSADRVRLQFPGVKVLPLKDNLGVDAFNRAVRIANSDTVLILDDDACPDQGTISAAVDILTRRPDIAAVALHPRHPLTGKSEWPFAHLPAGKALRDGHWPVMGCGNLIRRDAWLDAGGYEPAFFLYRNDTDLALKLLGPACTAKTRGVYFDPALTVWHDSPGAARKSRRWHRLATRNWIWMARRHGRGLGRGGVCGALLGWTWAHRLAGISPRRHAATFLGALSGVLHRPPSHAVSDGRAFASLVRLQIAGWLNARSGTSPAPARLSVAARKPLSSAPGHSTPPR